MSKRSARPTDAKVVVAYIHPGQTSAFFTQSLLLTIVRDRAERQRIVGVEQEWSSANVSSSRNSVTGKFLDNYDAEWLWWIDADMAWDHDALERLMAVADKESAPVVGGLCFGATGDTLFPTIYQLTATDDGPRVVRSWDYEQNAVLQVAATGAAFLLIHRSVLEAVRDKGFNAAFPWFQETELAGDPVGEDITFCLRVGMCGFPVHVHTGIEVGHHKSHLLTAALHRQQRIAARVTDADTGPIQTIQ
jgi:hypothetical protein